MKKKLIITALIVMCMVLFALSLSAAAPMPPKPDLGVDFGEVSTIEGFTPPSQLYVNTTERVLLTDGNGNYVTYPTYYITKDSTKFEVDFSKFDGKYSNASIVMLEIPNGVTALPDYYFNRGRFESCLSVQIPGTVTNYGKQLFAKNSIIRVVEFLDGTDPVTIGDGMFSGGYYNGSESCPYNLNYVKFPNNLVSIGNNTFSKCVSNKTIILGENLTSFGTGFFGESTPRDKDTFIYVSNKFFSDTSTMFTDMFGPLGQFHNKHLRLTIFYTGTKEEATKLVEAGAALQTGYVFNNTTYVSADEYVYDTHKPKSDGHLTLVYDYNECDAFYNGVHEYDDSNPCVKACVNCGLGTIEHCDSDSETFTISYENGYSNKGVKHTTCTNKGCTLNKKEDTLPLFATEGYSTPENGDGDIAILFTINYDAIDAFEKNASKSLKFGVFAILYDNIGENGILNNESAITVDIEDNAYVAFEMRISGFETVEQKDAKLSIGGYVIDEKGNVSYMQASEPNEGEKLSYISYNDIYGAEANS